MSAILVKIPPPMRSAARPEGFADGETDEAGAGQFRPHPQQNADHANQFDANQQQADAHARTQRDHERLERAAPERGERGAAVGGGVDTDTEPRHAITAKDAQHRAAQDDDATANQFAMGLGGIVPGQADEVINHAHGDHRPKHHEEFSLLRQIGFARLPNHVGDVAHGLVHRQRAAAFVFIEAEQHANHADGQSQIQKDRAAQTAAQKCHPFQVRQFDVGVSRKGVGS